MNKLEEICTAKREEVRERQSATPVSELIAQIAAQTPPRGFEAALRQTHADGRRALIACARAGVDSGRGDRATP